MDEGKATEPCQAGQFNVNNIPERVTIMYYLNHYVNCGKNSHIVWQANFFYVGSLLKRPQFPSEENINSKLFLSPLPF